MQQKGDAARHASRSLCPAYLWRGLALAHLFSDPSPYPGRAFSLSARATFPRAHEPSSFCGHRDLSGRGALRRSLKIVADGERIWICSLWGVKGCERVWGRCVFRDYVGVRVECGDDVAVGEDGLGERGMR